MTFARIITLIVAAIVIAGCSGSGQAGGHPTGRVLAEPAGYDAGLGAESDRGGSGAIGSQAHQRPTPPAMLNPSPAPGCPMVVANPVGCPVPAPRPIVPLLGHARIVLCPPWRVGAPLPTALVICGGGFRPAESVAVVIIGRSGTLLVPTHAAADGTIRVALPQTVCRIAPVSIAARGNQGSVSNTIAVTPVACRAY